MLCLRVSLNGRHLTTAGLPGFGVVTAMLHWAHFEEAELRHVSDVTLSVGGSEGESLLGWHDGPVRPGDTVTIEVCEAALADVPHRTPLSKEDGTNEVSRLQRELQRLESRLSEVREALWLRGAG
ncbi:hypothetical protein [Myxococcus sp. CA039A]|uniref:hypothetical protein n=1 Tax=Myxococcus sp. CA039A TaxID=2741737 RepID=UPI00157A9BF0|nr:hypothetical protein [Myxococcus sp. CA039A]NTX53690.1 hypothetical protein [Myxococcus sp. CA039A]